MNRANAVATMYDAIEQALRNAYQMAIDAGAEYCGDEPMNGLAELADQMDAASEDLLELKSMGVFQVKRSEDGF